MNVPNFVTKAVQLVKSNSPEILTALGVSGVIGTAYLTGRASFDAARIIDRKQYRLDNDPKTRPPHVLELKEKAQLVWKLYIPATISGAFSISCIIGSAKSTSRRTAAAVTAYSLTERAFAEYKEKVVEQLGETAERKIRDEVAQDRVTKNPPSSEVIIVGGGHVLCCELFTHRYFRSDIEALKKAQNDINAQIIGQHYVSLSEFYDLINLPYTSVSSNIGWNSDRLMELIFSTVLAEDGEPCLAFDYNYTKPLR